MWTENSVTVLSIASASVQKSATVSKLSDTESIYGALDLVDLKELTTNAPLN